DGEQQRGEQRQERVVGEPRGAVAHLGVLVALERVLDVGAPERGAGARVAEDMAADLLPGDAAGQSPAGAQAGSGACVASPSGRGSRGSSAWLRLTAI